MTHTPANSTNAPYRAGTATLYGRVFTTRVFDTDDATNNWLHANADWGVLVATDDGIHVARLDDNGQLAVNAPPPRFNHAFTIAFTIEHESPDGDGIRPQLIRNAILARLATTTDDELYEAIGAPIDTYRVDER